CIDKTSGAELTEAINLMFNYYKCAKVCFVYFADVSSPGYDQIGASRWFTRGWTLQELLAPPTIVYLDALWNLIPVPVALIADITGIPVSILQGGNIDDVSIACRMSWALSRKTSRIEDLAYCLLGIFDINMPLLYGEGMKAFTRLQEHIVQKSIDETIFLW
ncbi:hypothetical protein P154DRAFT_417858, partial [Amniculicola lignicola CBS 123094]